MPSKWLPARPAVQPPLPPPPRATLPQSPLPPTPLPPRPPLPPFPLQQLQPPQLLLRQSSHQWPPGLSPPQQQHVLRRQRTLRHRLRSCPRLR
jgi:hypothetical protein